MMLVDSWFSMTMTMTWGGVTVKFVDEFAVPPGVVTWIAPVVAPVGTVVLILVAEFTVKAGWAVRLNFTTVAPVKLVPLITTGVATAPLSGLKLLMVGSGDVPTLKVAMAPVHAIELLSAAAYVCVPAVVRIFHAACSPVAAPLAVDCRTAVGVYPAVWPLGVAVPFQAMPPTAISLAWVVAVVVPVDGVALLPDSTAVLSSGAGDAPATSSTVRASADAPVTVTVTMVTLAAPVAYQISASACVPCVTAAALTHLLLAESVTTVTVAREVVSRTLIAATRRSPLPLAVAVDADRVVETDVFAAPKD